MSAIRTVGHEDRLSLVDHLDELRTRLILCAAVLGVAFGFCFWQNHALLHIINKPLKAQTQKQVAKGEGTVGQAWLAQEGLRKVTGDLRTALRLLSTPGSGLTAGTRAALKPLQAKLALDVAKLPKNAVGDNPVTLGVGEPFTTTITVALYAALIISLPFLLYELYGFVVPALSPHERRAAVPLLSAVPFLAAGGVLFGYFIVLPAAVRFFVNFNAGEFNVLVQANQFYSFASTILLAMAVVFQVPVLILGATRLGLVTPRQLRKFRRYAIVGCAAVAAFLPGDAITLLLETLPLYLLYEASILMATFVKPVGTASADSGSSEGDPGAESPNGSEPTVQDMIDHVDPRL